MMIFDTYYTLLVLKSTFTSEERRKIQVEDFPETVVCPEASVDMKALILRGYSSPEHYYKEKNDNTLSFGN